jgi:hypothetical protein
MQRLRIVATKSFFGTQPLALIQHNSLQRCAADAATKCNTAPHMTATPDFFLAET